MRLIYQVYALEMKWLPAPGNPSGWTDEEDQYGPYFQDIFSRTAQYFGVFDGERLIGTSRAIRPVNGKLEIELYYDLPEALTRGSRVESNRVAILRDYADSDASLLLARELVAYLSESGMELCLTTSLDKAFTDFCLSLGLQALEDGGTFKYNPSDSQTVQILYLDCRDKESSKRIAQTLASLLNSRFRLL
jgi:hypothetical protein